MPSIYILIYLSSYVLNIITFISPMLTFMFIFNCGGCGPSVKHVVSINHNTSVDVVSRFYLFNQTCVVLYLIIFQCFIQSYH